MAKKVAITSAEAVVRHAVSMTPGNSELIQARAAAGELVNAGTIRRSR
jgi:hypothetical protein